MNEINVQDRMGSLMGPALQPKPSAADGKIAFGEVLGQSVEKVNNLQNQADAAVNDLTTGKNTDIHQTMIAVEKAGVAFELMMQLRNKVITAYETIMRMPV
jgi:flagellar hook-basal body complex protein FliE